MIKTNKNDVQILRETLIFLQKRKSMKIMFLFIIFSLSLTAFAEETFETLNFKQAALMAKSQHKKLFILAYAEGCSKARKLEEALDRSDIKATSLEHFVSIKMEMNEPENNFRVSNWGLRGSPTLVVIDPTVRTLFSTGMEGALEGVKTLDEVKAFLNDPSEHQIP